MKRILTSLMTVGCLLWAASAFAVPALQLDLSNGVYDVDTETVVSTNAFTLYALLDPNNKTVADASGKFYISMAVSPMVSIGSDLGSFTFAGETIRVTEDMVYGTPPVDLTEQKDTLQTHDVFPTYFKEFEFLFDDANQAQLYNVQDNPGGFSPLTTGDPLYLYYAAFDVDVSNLDHGYAIHFDLYNLKEDGSVDIFAPFSHDAQAIPAPEPSTLLLLGAGLAGLGGCARKFRR